MDNRSILEGLRSTEQSLRRKIEVLQKPLSQAEEDLRNIVGTIAFYERNQTSMVYVAQTSPATHADVKVGVFSAANLRGLTQTQAVITIAKHCGGVIKAQVAKHLMIQAEVMKSTKNSTRMVHNAIINSGRFERIAPGEFRLKVIGNGTAPSGTPTAAIAAGVFQSKPQ
jgi:hypothetical protein